MAENFALGVDDYRRGHSQNLVITHDSGVDGETRGIRDVQFFK